jgi:hydrogenase nickel incorporation protein HypA/HybF
VHEAAITQAILDTALTAAGDAGAKRVSKINLVVGELAGIADEAVDMYFSLLSRGTAAEGARLVYEHVPARFTCKSCSKIYDKNGASFNCPHCGGEGTLDMDAAKECYIDHIEAE